MTSAGAYYYKAVKSDGTDFRTGRVQWAPPDGHEGEWIVRHPTAKRLGKTATNYLSVATTPTDCTGMKLKLYEGKVQLPRLLLVEHIGRGRLGTDLNRPNKRTGLAFRYVDELDGMLTLGPQAKQIVALIERAAGPFDEAKRMVHTTRAQDAARARAAVCGAACGAGRVAAWSAGRDAARSAAWRASQAASWDDAEDEAQAAEDTARALVVRDLLTQEHYDALTRAWRETIGPIHPDDPAL